MAPVNDSTSINIPSLFTAHIYSHCNMSHAVPIHTGIMVDLCYINRDAHRGFLGKGKMTSDIAKCRPFVFKSMIF